jgi:hypothetical protein
MLSRVPEANELARDPAGRAAAGRADAWLAHLVQSIEPGKPLASSLQPCPVPGRCELKDWMAESCLGSDPLQAIAGSCLPHQDIPVTGDFIVLTVELSLDGTTWLGAAPLIVGGPL